MILLANLAIFSGLSLNLLLQFALGTSVVASDFTQKTERKKELPRVTSGQLPYVQFCILFISVLILWIFFNYILPVNWRGFLVYFLLFPLSALVCMGFEFLGGMLFPGVFSRFDGTKTFTAITAYDGLVPASLLIAFAVADNFVGAFVLALFFPLGSLIAMLILNEIHRKSALEWVPRYLRGSPLILISMGLLSLIAATVAGIFFRILEVF